MYDVMVSISAYLCNYVIALTAATSSMDLFKDLSVDLFEIQTYFIVYMYLNLKNNKNSPGTRLPCPEGKESYDGFTPCTSITKIFFLY